MFHLTTEEVRDLIQGRFQVRNCLECCGAGWVLVDTDIGEIVQSYSQDKGPESYSKDQCEDCKGLGCFVIWS